jgi:ubiquinone/menaquinone biosynthesis C-methylase UbiE
MIGSSTRSESTTATRTMRDIDLAYHQIIASEYDAVVVLPRTPVNDLVFARCESFLRPGSLMVDLGCGTGHATLRFGRLFTRVIAVDHSEAMQSVARRQIKARSQTNVEFLTTDVLAFVESLAPNTIDFVTGIGFFHHLSPADSSYVIEQVKKGLKPNGQFLVSEPRVVSPSTLPSEIATWNASSVAPSLVYSVHEKGTEEAPIEEGDFIASLYRRGLFLEYIAHHWEIFPKTLPPSVEEVAQIQSLHDRLGYSGNAVTLIATRSSVD